MTPESIPNQVAPDPYSSKWSDLIGPEYAAIIRPYRKLILVGGVGLLAGLVAGLFWIMFAGRIPDWADFLGAWAFFFPGFGMFTIGLVLQSRLSYKINYDLWAVGVLPPKISPDLINPSRFLYWSRHFGVTTEQVQAAGKRAAELRAAPDARKLWDFTSKKPGDDGEPKAR